LQVRKSIKSFFLTVFIFIMSIGTPALAASQNGLTYAPVGAVKVSPPENVFYVDGKGFVMLDLVDGDNGGIFCISHDSYGNVIIDSWGNPSKLDTELESNLAYKLNKELLKEKENVELEALPDAIINKIDRNHKWFYDRGRTFNDFETVCGINLISIDEYKKYVNLIGVNDSDFENWWTRSPYIVWDDHYLTLGCEPAGKTSLSGFNQSGQVRPCFWLEKDFFETTKLDIYRMGSKIKKILIDFGEDKLFKIGYSKAEIEEIKKKDTDISEFFKLKLPKMPDTWYGVTTFDFELNIELYCKSSKTYKVKAFLDGNLIQEKNVKVSANSSEKVILNTGEMTNAKHNLKVEVYYNEVRLWECTRTFDVIQEYEHQFMEEYSGKGFNHHIMHTQFIFAANTPAEQYKLMQRVGSMAIRDGYEWPSFETTKKMYLWNDVGLIKDMVAQPGPLQMTFGYNNHLYSDNVIKGGDSKYTPVTKENLDNYSEYMSETIKHFKGIDYPMIWNEPIGDGFWKPGVDIPSYSLLVMASVGLAKNAIEDTNLKPSWTIGSAWTPHIEDLVNKGGYSYFDAWTAGSYKPGEESLDKKVIQLQYLKQGAGGWKDLTAYEFGASTNVGGDYTKAEQAALVPLQMILFDEAGYSLQAIYQFNDYGQSPTEREQNFGVTDAFARPKPSLYSIAAHFRLLNGAKFLGRIQQDNLYTFYYYKDGQVIEIDYVKDGTKVIDVTGKTVYDLNGNRIMPVNNEIVVGGELVYIFGNKKDKGVKASANSVRIEAEYFYDYYANLMGKERKYDSFDKFDKTHVDNYRNLPKEFDDYIDVYEEDAFGFEIIEKDFTDITERFYAIADKGMPTQDEMEKFVNEYYALGLKFIKDYKDGKIYMSTREFSGFLYLFHQIGEKIANVYMMTVPQNERSPEIVTNIFEQVRSKMRKNENKVPGGVYEYSNSMLRIAEKYVMEAYDVNKLKENNPQKAGVIHSRNLIGKNLILWIEEFMELEGISHNRIVLQMTRANRKLYNFSENEAVFSLYNFGKVDFDGEVEFYDSEGTMLFKTPASVKANDSTEVKCKFNLQNTTENRKLYTMKLTSGGEVYYEEVIDDIELAETAVVNIMPASVPAENLDSITVKVENTFNSSMTYSVKLKAPEGWRLVNDEKSVSVEPGHSKDVVFEIAEKQLKNFNEYYFDIVLSSDGVELVNQKQIPLMFLYIPKLKGSIDVEGFDGEITSWKNTYPVMLSVPENPENPDSWLTSEASLKMYTQWDSSALYILAVLYDNNQLNDKLGANIWNGDSIQLSIDTANNKTGYYDDDDMELGFALTDMGLQKYAWHGESEAFSNMSYNIIRNNSDNTTKYLLKIPREALKSMKLEKGYVFGMNVVLNDADTVLRTYWDELTYGTGYSKSPIYYYDWILGN